MEYNADPGRGSRRKREMHAQTKWIRTISEREDYDSLTGGADTDAL